MTVDSKSAGTFQKFSPALRLVRHNSCLGEIKFSPSGLWDVRSDCSAPTLTHSVMIIFGWHDEWIFFLLMVHVPFHDGEEIVSHRQKVGPSTACVENEIVVKSTKIALISNQIVYEFWSI